MKLHWGPPPEIPLPPDEGWAPVPELSPDAFVAAGAVVGFGLFLGVMQMLRPVYGTDFLDLLDPVLALVVVIVVPVHEFIHAAGLPGGLRSDSVLMGLWLKKGLPYVMPLDELSRERMVIAALAPFLVLTSAPLVIALAWPAPWLLVIALTNGALAGGDLIWAATLLLRVPRRARLRNQGWRTSWRPGPEVA